MTRFALVLVLLAVSCTPRAAVTAPPPDTSASDEPAVTREVPAPEPTGAPSVPVPDAAPAVQPPPPPQVPMPAVAVSKEAFLVGTVPTPRRASAEELRPFAEMLSGWGVGFMQQLDRLRGVGPYARITGLPPEEYEWVAVAWPGPFQGVVRRAVNARPPQGRFFHLENTRLDAGYLLPYSGMSFVEATITFRDHAEEPPASGELWYTWHVRLMTGPTGGIATAAADGYDASARTWMRSGPAWTAEVLYQEAEPAVAGYLWSESYVAGGGERYSNVPDTTPFWHVRIDALNELNRLYRAGSLTDRRFEDVRVRVVRFDPLTIFGAGVVTAAISGRLVETIDGKTRTVEFTQPTKFFRAGGTGTMFLSAWTAVDAEDDGEWVSGGVLALEKLQTSQG